MFCLVFKLPATVISTTKSRLNKSITPNWITFYRLSSWKNYCIFLISLWSRCPCLYILGEVVPLFAYCVSPWSVGSVHGCIYIIDTGCAAELLDHVASFSAVLIAVSLESTPWDGVSHTHTYMIIHRQTRLHISLLLLCVTLSTLSHYNYIHPHVLASF